MKFFFSLCVVLVYSNCLGQSDFQINLKLQNSSGKKFYLTNGILGSPERHNEKIFDSAISIKNQITFKGKLKEYAYYGIRLHNSNHLVSFIIDENIKIEGNVDEIESSVITFSNQNYWKSRGDSLVMQYSKKREFYQDSLIFYSNLNNEIKSNYFSLLMDSMDMDFVQNDVTNFIIKYPTSYYGLTLIKENYYINKKTYSIWKSLFQKVDENLIKSKLGKQLYFKFYELENNIKPGSDAQFLKIVNTLNINKVFKIRKNEITIIDFWASWCGPCIAKLPDLKVIEKKFRNKKLRVVSISLDEKYQNWKNAIKQNKIMWENYCDLDGFEGDVASKYDIRYIPFVILFDKSAKLVKLNPNFKEIENFIINN